MIRRVTTEMMASAAGDLVGDDGAVLQRVLASEPALQARALQRLLTAERALADQHNATYPDLDDTDATAIAGGLIGAVRAVGMRSMERGDTPEQRYAALDGPSHSSSTALAPLERCVKWERTDARPAWAVCSRAGSSLALPRIRRP